MAIFDGYFSFIVRVTQQRWLKEPLAPVVKRVLATLPTCLYHMLQNKLKPAVTLIMMLS